MNYKKREKLFYILGIGSALVSVAGMAGLLIFEDEILSAYDARESIVDTSAPALSGVTFDQAPDASFTVAETARGQTSSQSLKHSPIVDTDTGLGLGFFDDTQDSIASLNLTTDWEALTDSTRNLPQEAFSTSDQNSYTNVYSFARNIIDPNISLTSPDNLGWNLYDEFGSASSGMSFSDLVMNPGNAFDPMNINSHLYTSYDSFNYDAATLSADIFAEILNGQYIDLDSDAFKPR